MNGRRVNISNSVFFGTERRHTLLSVTNAFPEDFSFLDPPEPPAGEGPDGGASGIVNETSTPESTVEIIISFGRGTGERLRLSIAQFNAIVASLSFGSGSV